jgi:hypothetical protein
VTLPTRGMWNHEWHEGHEDKPGRAPCPQGAVVLPRGRTRWGCRLVAEERRVMGQRCAPWSEIRQGGVERWRAERFFSDRCRLGWQPAPGLQPASGRPAHGRLNPVENGMLGALLEFFYPSFFCLSRACARRAVSSRRVRAGWALTPLSPVRDAHGQAAGGGGCDPAAESLPSTLWVAAMQNRDIRTVYCFDAHPANS